MDTYLSLLLCQVCCLLLFDEFSIANLLLCQHVSDMLLLPLDHVLHQTCLTRRAASQGDGQVKHVQVALGVSHRQQLGLADAGGAE